MLRWFTLISIVFVLAALGCPPEDRDPVLIGGDGDADGDVDDGGGDGEPVECDGAAYPCGPYGNTRCDVIRDLSFIPANDAATAMAGDDGLLSLSDIAADPTVTGIMLYGTAVWCTACHAESSALNEIQEAYQTEDENVVIVAVVFQDEPGEPADVDVATDYGARYDFQFPTVADTSGDVLYYFDASSTPGNIFIDTTTMRIVNLINGFVEPTIRSTLGSLDGSVECREY